MNTYYSCGKAILSVTELRWPTELTQGGGLLLNYSSNVGKSITVGGRQHFVRVNYIGCGGGGSSNMPVALFIDVWSLDCFLYGALWV